MSAQPCKKSKGDVAHPHPGDLRDLTLLSSTSRGTVAYAAKYTAVSLPYQKRKRKNINGQEIERLFASRVVVALTIILRWKAGLIVQACIIVQAYACSLARAACINSRRLI